MMRAFPGWLRREAGYYRMVAVPTAKQEDARRVTRERKGLVREQTKLINRLKAMFACLGILDLKPHLKKAPERLDGLLTPEGEKIGRSWICKNGTKHQKWVHKDGRITLVGYHREIPAPTARVFAKQAKIKISK